MSDSVLCGTLKCSAMLTSYCKDSKIIWQKCLFCDVSAVNFFFFSSDLAIRLSGSIFTFPSVSFTTYFFQCHSTLFQITWSSFASTIMLHSLQIIHVEAFTVSMSSSQIQIFVQASPWMNSLLQWIRWSFPFLLSPCLSWYILSCTILQCFKNTPLFPFWGIRLAILYLNFLILQLIAHSVQELCGCHIWLSIGSTTS